MFLFDKNSTMAGLRGLKERTENVGLSLNFLEVDPEAKIQIQKLYLEMTLGQ